MRHDWSVEDYTEYRNGIVRASQKRRRAAAMAVGMCRICCIRAAREGRTTCQGCTDYILGKAKIRSKERRAIGVCTVCGKRKPQKGHVRCSTCIQRALRYEAIRKGVI